MPKGAYRSVTHFGPSGLGINADASPAKQRAAWQFITWATSKEIQVRQLQEADGSFTRRSTWNAPPIEQAEGKPPAQSSIPNVAQPLVEAWQAENIGMGPHTRNWNALNESLFSGISQAINKQMSPQEAMERIDSDWQNTLS